MDLRKNAAFYVYPTSKAYLGISDILLLHIVKKKLHTQPLPVSSICFPIEIN